MSIFCNSPPRNTKIGFDRIIEFVKKEIEILNILADIDNER